MPNLYGNSGLRKVAELSIIHLVIFCAATLLHIVIFRLFSYMRFIDVVFFQGILSIMVVGAIIPSIMLHLMRTRLAWLITYRDIVISILLFGGVNMVFFTHVPVTAERSISVFILSSMADRKSELVTEEAIEDYFIEKYVKDYGAVEFRLREQVIAGNIELKEDRYQLTKRGQMISDFYDTVTWVYGIDKRITSPGQGNRKN